MTAGPLENLNLPAHFGIRRLRDVAEINSIALSADTDPGYRFRYIDISSVGTFGEMRELEEMTFADAPSRARRVVRSGDILVSTVRTYLRAITRVVDADDVIASTGFAVVTPGADIDPEFLFWWINSSNFVEHVVSESVGVSYPAINAEKLAHMPVPYPSLEEQKRIAGFLEREHRETQNLRGEMERSARLLIERRIAIITAAVTGQMEVA